MHGAPLRGVVINPTPPRYGIDEPAGCVVQCEMALHLTELSRAEDGRLHLAGKVRIRGQQEPVLFAQLSLHLPDGRTASLGIAGADEDFVSEVEAQPGAELEVRRLGCRSLSVSLARSARLARAARADRAVAS